MTLQERDVARSGEILEIDDPAWQAFAGGHPHALPFHLPPWARTLEAAYGLHTRVWAATSAGRVVAGVPVVERRRRASALPFTDACPPLTAPELPAEAVADWLDAMRVQQGLTALEVRAPVPGGQPVPGSEAYLHVLSLDAPPDKLLARMHRSQVVRNIDKARRSGIRVRPMSGAADLLDVFYPLHVATRHRLGVPVQPKRYFTALHEHVLGAGHGFGLVAEDDTGAPVAAAVFLTGGSTTVYKYGASLSSAWPLRPNHALFWRAIEMAYDAGSDAFDFGRTGVAEESLRQFKQWWGTVEQPTAHTCFGTAPQHRPLRHVPAIASTVLRRSPAFVTRASGAVLYRFAG